MNRHARIRTLAAALTALAAFALTACEGDTTDSKPATVEQPADDVQATDDAQGGDGGSSTATLEDMVGEDLQYAQDTAQAAGFYNLDDQDASGQSRLQVFDRNWQVCSQDPEPGDYSTDTKVVFYAVKDDESC